MRLRLWLSVTLAAALAACGTPAPAPQMSLAPTVAPAEGMPADGQRYPDGNPYRLLAVEELPVIGVSVDSQLTNFPKERLIDGTLSTQWTNGGYRPPTSWAAVELAASATVASIGIKTGPSPAGTSFDVQTSEDGANWVTRLSNQTVTSWNLEIKTLPPGSSGKFVRVFWRNNATNPQAHFSIFELEVNGEAGPAPTPTPTPTASVTPTPAPTATPTPAPTGTPTGATQRLTTVSATASSSYTNLGPQRAIDGNASTQWSNGGYREAEAWHQVRLNNRFLVTGVRLKTGALPSAVSYRIETSIDGLNWTPASGNLTNTTWNLEAKTVDGEGEFLRVRFFNSASAPIARFSIYELEVYGRAGTNSPPIMANYGFTGYKVPIGGTTELFAQGTDVDGDPLTYTWTVTGGTVTGSGPRVTYHHIDDFNPVEPLDEQVTVTVSDGRGGSDSETFTIDIMSGRTTDYGANQALEWDPARTVSANLSGMATITVSGDMSRYDGVICEYSSGDAFGRRMVILRPGVNPLPLAASGFAYCYLLKYPVENIPEFQIPDPNITLTFQSDNGTTTGNLTGAHVSVIPDGKGFDMYAPMGRGGTPTAQFLAGENEAFNGPRNYHRLLWVLQSPYYTGDGSPHVFYEFLEPGQDAFGWAEGSEDSRLFFTDSLGGAGDNTGFWRVYEYTFD